MGTSNGTMETRIVNIPEKSLVFPAWKTIGFLVHVIHLQDCYFQIFTDLLGLKIKHLSPRSSSNCTKSSPEKQWNSEASNSPRFVSLPAFYPGRCFPIPLFFFQLRISHFVQEEVPIKKGNTCDLKIAHLHLKLKFFNKISPYKPSKRTSTSTPCQVAIPIHLPAIPKIRWSEIDPNTPKTAPFLNWQLIFM